MSEADITKNNIGGDFKLMQTLGKKHKGSVRCVTVLPDTDMIISGSMDKVTNVYQKDEGGQYQFVKEFKYHDNYVYSLCPK